MSTPSLAATVQINKMLYPRSGFQDGDWCILSCSVSSVQDGEPYDSNICVKGNVFGLQYGSPYNLLGELTDDPRYGYSYNIVSFARQIKLDSKADKLAYVESVCTPKQFDALVQAVSDPYTALLNRDVPAICTAKGFGPKSAEKVISRFHDDLENAEAYVTLGQYGLSITSIRSLLKRFSSPAACIAAVEKNPYLMITTVDGIGWKRADAIALMRGIAPDSEERICAYINYLLMSESESGHTYITPLDLINATFAELEIIDQEKFRDALFAMHERNELWWNEDRTLLALRWLRDMEVNIAHELYRLYSAPKEQSTAYDATDLSTLELEQGWCFTDEQHQAINKILTENVIMITGQAGTGKSSVVAGALKALGDCTFAQCALSGRAAARLTEVTGVQGSTIHRLLGYMHGEFTYNKDNPLPYDIIILDEISMVGADIFLKLLNAIPTGSKLIMLGDDGQLESIGLCNLMNDMLKSNTIPVMKLTKIHRQAAKSAIITEAAKVRNHVQLTEMGWVGHEVRGELQDLTLEIFSESLLSQDTILEQYQALLDEGISPYDIQVVVPMRQRGSIATCVLNQKIQAMVNPNSKPVTISKSRKLPYELTVGDRAIIVKNTYDSVYDSGEHEGSTCPVYNGDRGVIKEISDRGMVIAFDLWGDVFLTPAQARNVELGYALTCHKLQGSEAPYVIIGIDNTSRILLTKEWLYTAITRAKKRCILCAQGSALVFGISTSNVPVKRTMLQDLLRESFRKEDNSDKS